MHESNQIINEQVKSQCVILIMDDGRKFGKIMTRDALVKAKEKQLDLLQVSDSSPEGCPVCKLVDFGKLKYQEAKRSKQHITTNHILKEIRISYNISDHDLETKNRQVCCFLEKGYRVKYLMRLAGREKFKLDEARNKFDNVLVGFSEFGAYSVPSTSQPLEGERNTDKSISISTLIVPHKQQLKIVEQPQIVQ